MDYKHEIMHMTDYDIIDDIIDTMFEIDDELLSADDYIHEAMRLKPKMKELADNKMTISSDEISHAEKLMNNIVKMFEKFRADEHLCYPVLSKVWGHVQKKQLDWLARIKLAHDRYKK